MMNQFKRLNFVYVDRSAR